MKKNFLFGLMAIALAAFSFGGVSLANTIEVANFEGLSAAFANASAGDEIVLTNNIDISENAGISVNKTLTLDLNNHTINYNTNAATKSDYQDLFDVEENGDLTIDGNGTINGPANGATYDGKVLIAVHGKLTYKNGTMNTYGASADGMYGVYVLDGGTAIFGDENGGPTISSWFGAIGSNNTTSPVTIIVNGGRYEQRANPNNASTWWSYFCAPIYAASKGNYQINGGEFIGFYGLSTRYLHNNQNISFGDNVTITASSNVDIFVDNKPGTTEGTDRVIIANGNTMALPDGYIRVQDGNVYKVGHSISFVSNGGSDVVGQAIVEGKFVVKPANPTKDNNVFSAWFKEAGFENERDFNSDKVMWNITLYAKWEAMISAGTAEIEQDDGTGTGMVVDVDAPATPTSLATEVQADNSTAIIQGEVELDVYNDANLDGTKDDTNPIPTKVNFTSPVLVRIPVNATGSVKVKVRHNGQTLFGVDGLTTNSGATCTSGVASIPYDGSPIPVVGGYVEIYTCSASTFVAYTETQNPTTPTYGGGGGSTPTYSCKNLPDNAVANNTTKPSKNTDYSYSTNTGAVCTFQCKDGYTWNTDKKTCDKADETVNTGDDTTDDTNTENLDPKEVLANGFTREFNDAYEFAFANGITTMKTIQEAAMEDGLNRIAMAKMLSQYAINVLKKTPDTNKECKFSDVSEELDAQYDHGVTLACQLGIMGVGITEFRPDDLVVRAEFGTALSRLLFGLADGEYAYYTTHLAKLKEAGIISNDDPSLEELRGYVMLMLMRSAK